jgi:hypothetical protein
VIRLIEVATIGSWVHTLAWLVWMVFFVANDPSEETAQAKHHQFLGPGGPVDPFANDPYDD